MRARFVFTLVLAVGLAAFGATKAEAGFIDLTNYPAMAQPTDSGKGTLEAWLLGLVNNYNANFDPDLPAPGLEEFRNINDGVDHSPGGDFPAFGLNVVTLNIPVGGYEYLVLHWGGPAAPCGTHEKCADPNYQAIYIGDPGAATFYTASNLNDGHGLSSYGLYNPVQKDQVPDGGMTLTLLGGVLVGLGALRRRVRL
jgi:hypothetical protein